MTDQWPNSESVQKILRDYDKSAAARKRWASVASFFLLGLLASWYFFNGERNKPELKFLYEPVKNGELNVFISATGNLQPSNRVQVSTEVSGTIATINADFNENVQKGQILFSLEASTLEAQVVSSRARLEFERAKLRQAELMVQKALNDNNRFKQLHKNSGGTVPSQSELDTAEIDLQRAQAEEASAAANVSQAKASLNFDETNLKKSIVRSPIDGVVLDRKIDVGQTVAASFEVPELFVLAENLHKLELHVDINEADVGRVKNGQHAFFTVDAYPERRFEARIRQVRYGYKSVDGVVSYEAVLDVDNFDLSLLPGMTAVADVLVVQRKEVLLVSNAAFNFDPSPVENIDEKEGGAGFVKVVSSTNKVPKTERNPSKSEFHRIWVRSGEEIVEADVKVGASDGVVSEVVGGGLSPGMEVAVASLEAER